METNQTNTAEPAVAVQIIRPDTLPETFIVVSDTLVAATARGLQLAKACTIKTPEDFTRAKELFGNLKKFKKTIKDGALDAGKSLRDLLDQLRSKGEEFTVQLDEGIGIVEAEILTWTKLEEQRRLQAIEEQRKKEAEAEAERKKIAVEKDRLEREAAQREKVALEKLDTAKTEKTFEAAAVQFDQAQAVKQEASELLVPFVAAPVVTTAAAAPIPKKVDTKGLRPTRKAVIQSYDLALLPVEFHELNEPKLRKAILDGFVKTNTPGVVFTIEEGFTSSGR